eukprot:SAG31_NODE_2869_length_4976_cov_1.541111_5_plen_223_part_00
MDNFFLPIKPASLEQLLAVTKDISEMTRILIAPLGLSPKLQELEDSVLEAAVRDRLATGSPAAVELACEKHGISPGMHALAAVTHEKHPKMKELIREQEEVVQTLFNPPVVVDLPLTASAETLARMITELDGVLGERITCCPFDGQQARLLLMTVDQLNRKNCWVQSQLQAIAECCVDDAGTGILLENVRLLPAELACLPAIASRRCSGLLSKYEHLWVTCA